jgi:hypothetical protein
MIAIFAVILAGGVLLLLIVGGSFAWVLGPLERAARTRRGAIQFSLADFLCLFVLVQLPLGAVHGLTSHASERSAVLGFDLLAAGIAVVGWLAGIQLLSNAGIRAPWHRFIALAVVMPITIFGNFALVLMPAMAVVMLGDQQYFGACCLFVAEVLLVAVFFGLGKFTRMIAASAEPRFERQSEIETPSPKQ